MPKKRRETVSVSFHYFVRGGDATDDELSKPVTQEDFEHLCNQIKSQPAPDTTDPKVMERIRFGTLVPFHNFHQRDDRCIFGTFEAPYSGHSFKNSEKGKITAGSVNQRQFHYCLYLSEKGRLYVGNQYLGNYGSYYDLKSAIRKYLPKGPTLRDFAIRDDSLTLENVVPKEIQIEVSNVSDDIHKDNILGRRSAIVLKRDKKGSDFEKVARDRIRPIFQSKAKNRAKMLADTLNELGLFSVSEGEIVDGKMIVEKGKGQQTIYLFQPGNFATRYPLDVPLNEDGHPEMEPVRSAMYQVLEESVIIKTAV